MQTAIYGVNTFPVFGGVSYVGGKSSAVDQTTVAFNNLKSALTAIPIVEGNEALATHGWEMLASAYAILAQAYGGKSITNGH